MPATAAPFRSCKTKSLHAACRPASMHSAGFGAEDVHQTLSETHLLVCPTRASFNEGLAFVCFEAALHGVPTVMSEVVPARDLLGGGCVVVEADSVNALASALDAILGDEARYENLRSTALEKSAVVFDRSKSWGSQLYRAFAGPC